MPSAWSRPRTQGFGPTSEALDGPYNGYAHFNKGIDFGGLPGDSVELNIPEGTVVSAGWANDGWGYSVKIRDAAGNTHNYGHLDPNIQVKAGDKVTRGQVIGFVGAKQEGEASTGSHLSYDVWNSKGEFFDPEEFVSGASGGEKLTMPSPVAGGRDYDDPELDARYKELKSAFIKAQGDWIKAGRPSSGELFDAYQEAIFDFSDFTDSFGHPTTNDNDTDPAQQAFDNAIKLGDYEGRRADRAFQQWFDRYSTAMGAATFEQEGRAKHNADLVALVDARNKSMTPGSLPRPTDRGYVEEGFGNILDRWTNRLGVSNTPPEVGASGVTTPGSGAPTTQTPSWYKESIPGSPVGWQGPMPPEPETLANQWSDQGKPPIPASTRGFPHYLGQNVLFTSEETRNPSEAKLSGMRPSTRPQGGGLLSTSRAAAIGAGIGALGGPVGAATGAATGAAVAKGAKKAKKWWQRAFASGGMNIPAGPGWVGERGPEIMEVPGFGQKIVGQDGPEEVFIPEGANIIPTDEAFMLHRIRSEAAKGPQGNMERQMMAQQQRANDPQLREKVMAALQKSLASNLAVHPPYTPVLENPAVQRDIWAPWRALTGVPASQEEAAMMQEQAAKGAKK